MNRAEPPDGLAGAIRELAQVVTDLGPAFGTKAGASLLESIAAAARMTLEAEACSVAVLDEGTNELVFVAVSGGAEEAMRGRRMRADRGFAGWVVSSGQPISVQDATSDARFARDVAEEVGFTPASLLALPLESERRTLGVIEVLDPRGGRGAGVDDLAVLGTFARQAALAIESQEVFADLGGAMLAALGRVSESAELRAALDAVAADRSGARAELAELAALFVRLGDLGSAERRLAVRLLGEIVDYLGTRHRG